MYEKKANALIKIYNDTMLSKPEWEVVGFHFYNSGRAGVLNNALSFYDGLMKYMHSEHFGNIPGQQAFDFGEMTWN